MYWIMISLIFGLFFLWYTWPADTTTADTTTDDTTTDDTTTDDTTTDDTTVTTDDGESLEYCPGSRFKGNKIYTLPRTMTDYSVNNLDPVKNYIIEELMDGISSNHLNIFRDASDTEKKDAIKIKELADNYVKFFFCCPDSTNCIHED